MTQYEKLSLRFLDGIFISLVTLVQERGESSPGAKKRGESLLDIYKELHKDTIDAFDNE